MMITNAKDQYDIRDQETQPDIQTMSSMQQREWLVAASWIKRFESPPKLVTRNVTKP